MGKKRIKFKVGDLLISYRSGTPEVGILHKKHPSYYCIQRERMIPVMWEILGWETDRTYMESFLKKQVKDELLEYRPVKK
tara:strand:+ start:2090 stop:2329 length:240 start_codon:yes stop_codon:yes gene_type:complete